MHTTTLQIPMYDYLRARASSVAKKQGFSSLQEIVRVFLKQLVTDKIKLYFSPTVILSEQNDKRYSKMISDVTSGKVKAKEFSDVNKLGSYLNK